jgi:ABC-2 type transport system permease protein
VILSPDNVPILTWLAPPLGVLFFYLSYRFWMLGAMKYNGTGS